MAGDFPNLEPSTMAHWPEPNSIDPVKRLWYLEFSIILALTTSVLLCARLWSQIRSSTKGFGIDDAFICTAWVFASLFTALSALGTIRYGFDKHIWDVPVPLLGRAALVQWLSEGAFILSTCFAKISVLCFFRRLEPTCTRTLKQIIYVYIALTATLTAAFLLTQILLCRPVAAYWDISKSNHSSARSCATQHAYYPLQGSLSSVSTFYSTVIPFLVLRNIPLSRFQRLGLRVVFIVGLCIVGIGIARAVSLSRLADSLNGDATWNGFNVFVLSQLECQLSLAAASFPYLHRFVSQYPRIPIAYVHPNGKDRNDSVISRVSSSLSSQIRRLPLVRSSSPRHASGSPPQMVEIPQWEFDALQTPRAAHIPLDEITYDRYVQGQYGPTPPPKDSREIFYQHRREHGEFVPEV